MNNFKFFQHQKCEYFPCHQNLNQGQEKQFNCLFCFCPLYTLGRECGGNFSYTHDIKDCSNCLIPHSEKGYDFIMKKWELILLLTQKNS